MCFTRPYFSPPPTSKNVPLAVEPGMSQQFLITRANVNWRIFKKYIFYITPQPDGLMGFKLSGLICWFHMAVRHLIFFCFIFLNICPLTHHPASNLLTKPTLTSPPTGIAEKTPQIAAPFKLDKVESQVSSPKDLAVQTIFLFNYFIQKYKKRVHLP